MKDKAIIPEIDHDPIPWYSDTAEQLLEDIIQSLIATADPALQLAELVEAVTVTAATSGPCAVYHITIYFDKDKDYYREKSVVEKLLLDASDMLTEGFDGMITYFFLGHIAHECGVVSQKKKEKESHEKELLEMIQGLERDLNGTSILEGNTVLSKWIAKNKQLAGELGGTKAMIKVVVLDDCLMLTLLNPFHEHGWSAQLMYTSTGLYVEDGPLLHRLIYRGDLLTSIAQEELLERYWNDFLDYLERTCMYFGEGKTSGWNEGIAGMYHTMHTSFY